MWVYYLWKKNCLRKKPLFKKCSHIYGGISVQADIK